jgi:phosphoglycerate dehydrogenase-like enzyme
MQQVHAGAAWGSPTGLALTRKTVGLVGFGGIGQALAQRLASCGMRIVAVKRTPDQALKDRFGLEWLKGMAALPELLKESVCVFVGVPLRQETQGLIGARETARTLFFVTFFSITIHNP